MSKVFQEYGRGLFLWMSVRADVELPLRAKWLAGRRREELVSEALAAVGLADAQTRAELEDLVRSLWRRTGVTIVFVTHDIDEAVYLGERVLVLSSSPTVVQEGLPVDRPEARDQLTTGSDPGFTRLRGHVYAQIQQAKRGQGRPTPPSPEGAAAAPGT
jgi:NitT/TauT family transport system ATP-binding protein